MQATTVALRQTLVERTVDLVEGFPGKSSGRIPFGPRMQIELSPSRGQSLPQDGAGLLGPAKPDGGLEQRGFRKAPTYGRRPCLSDHFLTNSIPRHEFLINTLPLGSSPSPPFSRLSSKYYKAKGSKGIETSWIRCPEVMAPEHRPCCSCLDACPSSAGSSRSSAGWGRNTSCPLCLG
jgi:hypothetical protein